MTQILRSRLLGRAIFVASLLNVALIAGVFVPRNWARQDRERDVVIYHDAARDVLGGRALYTMPSGFGPDRTHFSYLYAPPFAALISPLGRLPFVTFARAWSVLMLASAAGYAWCLARLYAPHERVSPRRWLAAALSVSLCHGTWRALSLGQVDPVLWLLFGAGLVALQDAQPTQAASPSSSAEPDAALKYLGLSPWLSLWLAGAA